MDVQGCIVQLLSLLVVFSFFWFCFFCLCNLSLPLHYSILEAVVLLVEPDTHIHPKSLLLFLSALLLNSNWPGEQWL